MKINNFKLLKLVALFSSTSATILQIESPSEYVSAVYYSQWSFPNSEVSQIPLSHITHIFYAFAGIDSVNKNIEWTDEDWEIRNELYFNISALQLDYNDLSFLNISENVNAEDYSKIPWISDYMKNAKALLEQEEKDIELIKVKGIVGQLRQLKHLNPRLKVFLSIGGSKSFKSFRKIAANKQEVKIFAANVAANIHRLGFDGVDIDWEYPSNQHDRLMLSYLIKYLYVRFVKLAEGFEERKIITLAIPVDVEILKFYDFPALDKYVSYYNLMGYDMSGNWSTMTSFQSNLYTDPKLKSSSISVDDAVKTLKEYIPKSKLILGMPAYGRSFNTDRLYSSFSNCADLHTNSLHEFEDDDYQECIVNYNNLPPKGYTEVSDTDVGAAYAYCNNTENKGIIFYDTPVISKQKARYVIDNGLGGGMWWDSQGDTFITNTSRSLIYNFVDELGGISKLVSNMTTFAIDKKTYNNIISVTASDQDFKDNTASKHSTGKYIILYILIANIFAVFI